jgi:hypothetical protein
LSSHNLSVFPFHVLFYRFYPMFLFLVQLSLRLTSCSLTVFSLLKKNFVLMLSLFMCCSHFHIRACFISFLRFLAVFIFLILFHLSFISCSHVSLCISGVILSFSFVHGL